jgi:arylsulfatase A
MNKPNIIFILADDMGYGDFSRFNKGMSKTPCLDTLMDQGVTLTQHYSASPVCNPSRAALMTGRYPHRTGSIDTLEWRGLERLALRERTMGDYLQSAGYTTGLIGKWHLGAFDPRYHPTRRGFDETVCFRGGMHDYYDWRIEWGTGNTKRGDGRYLTDLWTEEAVQFIHRHQKEPFFLHLTYNAPHTPLQAPENYIREFDSLSDVNWGVKCIYAMIKAMDEGVARITDTLNRLGLEENTILIFTSDNGPQFGGKGNQDTTRFNCQYHGAKGSTYEGGIRVPGIVRWPAGGITGGRAEDGMIHFTDWLPTLLSMTGTLLPKDHLPLDGIDVSETLRGKRGELCTERCWQWNRYEPVITGNAAARSGDWKLVRPVIREVMRVYDIEHLHTSMYNPEYFIENGVITGNPEREIPPPPPPELYNIAEDPLEVKNMADEQPDMVKKLENKLLSWFESVEQDRKSIDDTWNII